MNYPIRFVLFGAVLLLACYLLKGWLQQRRLIDARSRHDLLGNTLVLVAPARSNAQPLRLSKGTDLRQLLGVPQQKQFRRAGTGQGAMTRSWISCCTAANQPPFGLQ